MTPIRCESLVTRCLLSLDRAKSRILPINNTQTHLFKISYRHGKTKLSRLRDPTSQTNIEVVATKVSSPPNNHDTEPRIWQPLQDPPLTTKQNHPLTIAMLHPLTIAMLVTSPTTGSTTTFRFMDLAGELRNLIYEFILIEPHAVQLGRSAVDTNRLLWKKPADPPITCTNCQLRREALPIYYDINTFEVRLSSHLRRTSFHYLTAAVDGTACWLYYLSPERRIPVENLVLCIVDPRGEMILPGMEIHRKLRGMNLCFYISEVEAGSESCPSNQFEGAATQRHYRIEFVRV
ncbi:hypothetical protein LTR22_009883 [Elasticomyces elasticus]|nr:hypothetical protein LTR22_009883 [Elasticomyces elasticus]KAK5756521.1 hypothetical protein LTS12_013356 [Elasticomyces elasticus]